MNRTSLTFALLLLLAVPSLHGCIAVAISGAAIATGSTVNDRRGFGTVVDDKRIQLSAYDALNKDKELALKNNVNIAVYNGVMLLFGEVRTEELRARAERLTAGFEGVRRTVNEIVVGPPQGFWARRADDAMAARAKAALADLTSLPGFDPTKIKVSAARGTVYLLGIVNREEEDAVVDIVRNVNGVLRVVKIFEYTQ